MKRFVLFVLVAGLVLAVGSAWALTLQPNVLGTQPWNGGTAGSPLLVGDANEDGTPYWDGNSKDFTEPGNIGNFLAKTGAFSNHPLSPGVAYPYVASSPAGDLDIYFTTDAPNWASIRIEVAGLEEVNYFGVYKKDSPPTSLDDLIGLSSSANHIRLFTGAEGAGATKTFTIPAAWGGQFGWYLATEEWQIDPITGKRVSSGTGKAAWAWFSQSQYNVHVKTNPLAPQPNKQVQHFAFFVVKPNQAYYIGVEDYTVESSVFDADYQDFVVFASVVPDASTWMLFLSGVPALALLRRKRA
jgi:hypothetical protein